MCYIISITFYHRSHYIRSNDGFTKKTHKKRPGKAWAPLPSGKKKASMVVGG